MFPGRYRSWNSTYFLAQLGGNKSPSKDEIVDILSSVGIEAEEEKIDLLLGELQGKSFLEVLAAGREKVSSVPSGGVAVAATGAAPAAAAAEAPAEKKEAKKEEKKEEPEEEEEDEEIFWGIVKKDKEFQLLWTLVIWTVWAYLAKYLIKIT